VACPTKNHPIGIYSQRCSIRSPDAILPRRGPITRAMARRLQEDWAKDAGEGLRVLMSLRVDFGPMG